MNTHRIKHAADVIEKRERALRWLEEHGAKFTGKSEAAEGQFKFDAFVAYGCEGAREGVAMIQEYARANLPEIVRHAIECCNNDIGMARAQIIDELGIEL